MAEAIRHRRVWIFTRDLLFSSRIRSIVEAREIEVRRIQGDDFADLDEGGGLLLLDLDAGQTEVAKAITAARKADPAAWFLCGYGSHVDREGLSRMQSAGADLVLSRSRFLARLGAILADLFPSNS